MTGRPPITPNERLAAYATFAVRVDAILTRAVISDAERLGRISEQFTVLRDALAAIDSGSSREPAPSSPAGGTGPVTGAGPVLREEGS